MKRHHYLPAQQRLIGLHPIGGPQLRLFEAPLGSRTTTPETNHHRRRSLDGQQLLYDHDADGRPLVVHRNRRQRRTRRTRLARQRTRTRVSLEQWRAAWQL